MLQVVVVVLKKIANDVLQPKIHATQTDIAIRQQDVPELTKFSANQWPLLAWKRRNDRRSHITSPAVVLMQPDSIRRDKLGQKAVHPCPIRLDAQFGKISVKKHPHAGKVGVGHQGGVHIRPVIHGVQDEQLWLQAQNDANVVWTRAV